MPELFYVLCFKQDVEQIIREGIRPSGPRGYQGVVTLYSSHPNSERFRAVWWAGNEGKDRVVRVSAELFMFDVTALQGENDEIWTRDPTLPHILHDISAIGESTDVDVEGALLLDWSAAQARKDKDKDKAWCSGTSLLPMGRVRTRCRSQVARIQI